MARRRVRGETVWCQPLLPGLAEQLSAPGGASGASGAGGALRDGPPPGQVAMPVAGHVAGEQDWEARCFREACRYGCRLAALEAQLHAQRPGDYVVEGRRSPHPPAPARPSWPYPRPRRPRSPLRPHCGDAPPHRYWCPRPRTD